jgi:shikimate dehydrogenase
MSRAGVPFGEVIGDPIDHSRSPVIHCFWLEQLGISAGYRRHRVERGGLADYLDDRRQDPDWRGCNVTMPLKLDALAAADEASDRAIGTGAANILFPRDGRLVAGNTDVGGVVALLERLRKSGAPMDMIVLLGSGGGARSALMALHLAGVSNVQIQARNLNEAYKLAVQFGLRHEPRPFHVAVVADGLINTTPLGMTGAPPLAIDVGGLSAGGWVFDLVTSPNPTDLIRRASQRGLLTIDGLQMLVEQAQDSFKLLFDAEPPRKCDEQLFKRLKR